MADNVTANAGSGGSTFAADDIAGVYFPRTKLTIGADGSNDGDVSSANPLPVTHNSTVTAAISNSPTIAAITATVSAAIVNSPTIAAVTATVSAAITNSPTVAAITATVNAVITNSPTIAAVTATVDTAITNSPTIAAITATVSAAITNTPAVTVSGTVSAAILNAPNIQGTGTWLKGVTGQITDTSVTQVIASVSGKALNLTDMIVTNGHASVGTFVSILFNSTTVAGGYAAAAGGGFSHSFRVPLRSASGDAIKTQMATTGAAVMVTITAFSDP